MPGVLSHQTFSQSRRYRETFISKTPTKQTHHFLYISIRESAPKEPEAFNALSWSNFLWWRALVDRKIGKQLLKGDAEFSARKHWRVGSCKFLRVNLATFFFWFICINKPPSITFFFWSRLIKLSLEKKRGSLPGCSLSVLRDYILIMRTKIVIVGSILMNIWGWFYHGDAKVWIWVKFFSQHDCAWKRKKWIVRGTTCHVVI